MARALRMREDALVDAATRYSLFLPTDVAREICVWAAPRFPRRRLGGGDRHTVALKPDGSLVSWGLDSVGQVRDTPTGAEFGTFAADK